MQLDADYEIPEVCEESHQGRVNWNETVTIFVLASDGKFFGLTMVHRQVTAGALWLRSRGTTRNSCYPCFPLGGG